MDRDILRIDLDIKSKKKVLNLLCERLSYINDIGAFKIKNVKQIILNYKSSYNCKIYLHKEISPELIIMLQLILGSDYRKEINTMMNHYKFKMSYSNRLFDYKRYPNGKYKIAQKIDITKEILGHINSKRELYSN